MALLLLDWLNENAHRYYPFDPPAGNNVPTALILDFGLLATTNLPNNSGSNTTYISQIVTDGTQVRFYLSANIGGSVTDFGCIAAVDVNATIGLRTDFKYAAQNFVLEGYIITGDLSVTAKMPAVTALDASTGKIYTGCIQHMSQWLTGIRVGDQTLSGIVTLVAGPGISFSVSGNTVTILCTGAQLPVDNAIIIDDLTLRQSIEDEHGTPITQICGQTFSNGNWVITTDPDEGLEVTADSNTHSISIKNLNAVACCTQDDIATLVDNISALNDRVGVLDQFLKQIETNVNIISVQASRLV